MYPRAVRTGAGRGTPDGGFRALTEGDKARARFLSLHLRSYP
ncbi:hypothetical protein SUDANB66_00928 [Streptomyces sp. SudanB66_2053]